MKKNTFFDEIAERLKKHYNLKTDKELAVKLGVSPAIFSAWRKGKSKIDFELVFKKCSDLRMGWIIDGQGGKYDIPSIPEEQRLESIRNEYNMLLGRLSRLKSGVESLMKEIESGLTGYYNYPGDGYLIKSHGPEGTKYLKIDKAPEDRNAVSPDEYRKELLKALREFVDESFYSKFSGGTVASIDTNDELVLEVDFDFFVNNKFKENLSNIFKAYQKLTLKSTSVPGMSLRIRDGVTGECISVNFKNFQEEKDTFLRISSHFSSLRYRFEKDQKKIN